jgi:predicted TIM-barrel fold metal-dependent hydrolase
VIPDGVVDVVGNFPFLGADVDLPEWSKAFAKQKLNVDPSLFNTMNVPGFIDMMDAAGVAHVFLIAIKAGSASHRIGFQIPVANVAAVVEKHPDRFSGLIGVDPTTGMAGVRELNHAIQDLGFIGAHLYPHWFEMAPDHRKYYPFYAKCAELGVPIQMQVGHCLRYSDERPLASVGRPLTLDTVACDFPELTVIGIHTGWPWTEEMISVAYKHPNVYVATDAYAPRHLPASLVQYIDTWGRDKVLFGTDFPVLTFDRAIREVADLGLSEESRALFLRDNAIRVYSLPASAGVTTSA